MRFLKGKPVVRCSSLDQLISCPASRTLAAMLGVQEQDDRASWEGQWCHHQGALRFIKGGAMAPEGGLIGPKIPVDYKPESFAEWIVDYYHQGVMEETPSDWAMEVEGELLWEFPTFWLSGHCDVYAIAPDASALNFDDLKSGNIVVDAASLNWQVLGYAGLFKLIFDALKRIRGRIIQPRVKEGEEGKRVSSVIIDERGIYNDEGECVAAGVNINNFVALLVLKIEEALDRPMKLKTGLKQCRWCPADLQCPCLIAERNLMEMELTKEALELIELEPNDETLARWALARRMLGNKMDKAWDLFKERLAQGEGRFESKDGIVFLLKDWQGKRELSAEGKKAVWESVCADLDEARAFNVMSISIGDLERAYAQQLDIPISSKKKDSGESQVSNRFGQYLSRAQGKQLTIVT